MRSLQAVGVPSAVEAADGSEATALFEPGKFDLVVTDWNMPTKSVEAARGSPDPPPLEAEQGKWFC